MSNEPFKTGDGCEMRRLCADSRYCVGHCRTKRDDASRASVASMARYWSETAELSDLPGMMGPDLRFCLERCAELLELDL